MGWKEVLDFLSRAPQIQMRTSTEAPSPALVPSLPLLGWQDPGGQCLRAPALASGAPHRQKHEGGRRHLRRWVAAHEQRC
jgi:hypothetical protein